MKRTAFFVSDGTGITAEALGHSLLSQFESIDFEQVTLPYINNAEKAREALRKINENKQKTGVRPIIIDTIINQDIRKIFSECEGFMIDVFSTFLHPLEKELATDSTYTVGRTHSITDQTQYKTRINAVHFALDNDDGARTNQYEKADIILIGVSRSGKTPTCLYLALQFGICAANYPLTEDDLDDLVLPKSLKAVKKKLFGLHIDAERLSAIRQERKPDSRYSSIQQCNEEVRGILALYNRENIPYIDTSELSIEEISTRILEERKLERKTQG
jgi:regulator of PEP synthase PpsR (kinase-PPPase family)